MQKIGDFLLACCMTPEKQPRHFKNDLKEVLNESITPLSEPDWRRKTQAPLGFFFHTS